MALYRALPFVILAACASAPQSEPAPAEPESAPRNADPEVERLLQEETLARQEQRLLFQRRLEHAEAFYRAGELAQALEACEHALLLAPTNETARVLRQRIRYDQGHRDAAVSLIANEAAARAEIRLEEEKVAVRRLLHAAEKAKQNGDWQGARRAYERALFILSTSKFAQNAETERRTREALEDLARKHGRER